MPAQTWDTSEPRLQTGSSFCLLDNVLPHRRVRHGTVSYTHLSELFSKRLLKIKIENLGMPKFSIKAKWIIVGVLLPVIVDVYKRQRLNAS